MTLDQYFSAIRRRWRVMLLVLAVIGGLGITAYSAAPRIYTAKARVLVNSSLSDNTPYSILTGLNISAQLISSYAEIATARTTYDDVRARTGVPASDNFTLSASAEPQTLFIRLGASDRSPLRAQQLVTAQADSLTSTLTDLAKDFTNKVSIRTIDQPLLPSKPSSPSLLIYASIFGGVGIFLALLIAVVLEATDRTLRTIAEARQALGLSNLAVVPYRSSVKRRPIVTLRLEDPYGEPFRALRTALRFTKDDVWLKTLLVTSASPAEGKTTVASNLAVAMAQAGEKVCLVDADLRRGTLSKQVVRTTAKGLSDLMQGRAEIEEVIQSFHGVDVIPAGEVPQNPSELAGSEYFAQLLDYLGGQYDLVILDAPPALPVTDAVVMSTQVDGVLLVVRHAQTRAQDATKAAETFSAVDSRLVGYVLNASRGRQDFYVYESASA